MEINDNFIKEYYMNRHIKCWKNIPNEHKEYLENRFSDSESIKESCWRILYDIKKRPVCPICGNKVNFIGRKNNIFSKTCSNECLKKFKTKELTEEEIYYKSLSYKDKIKYTCQKKYGVDHPSQLESNVFKTSNPQKNQLIKEKTKNTRLNKYGQFMSTNNIKSLKTEEVKHKRVTSFNKTMIDKYGDITYRNLEKHKQTCKDKYGVDSWFKTDEYKNFMKMNNNDIQIKILKSKMKNHTFNTSKPENESYELLKEKYPDVQYQYKSEEYPFVCDFYIPKLNLYIECNYHWTHGGHPYDSNNINDYNKLKLWENKNTKFYRNAIITWTCRDVNKRNIANMNNLNYIEFWNINELKDWLKSNE